MEVSGNRGINSQRIEALEGQTNSSKATAPQRAGGSGLKVSDSARQLNDLVKLVENSSEVRPEKVEALKQKIEAGEYKVDLDKLADILVDEI